MVPGPCAGAQAGCCQPVPLRSRRAWPPLLLLLHVAKQRGRRTCVLPGDTGPAGPTGTPCRAAHSSNSSSCSCLSPATSSACCSTWLRTALSWSKADLRHKDAA
jgi:hypothetical protein